MNPTQSTTVGYTDVAVTRLGFGTAPLGNMYRDIPEVDARATVRHAYDSGIRLFDTAPLYGKGLSEERLGHALHNYPRDSYTISTKIGRVLNADRSDFTYDYSRDGVMRSLEGSLKRLQTDRVDVVLVHDPDADNVDHEQDALDEAFPTLIDLREQGVIGAVGSGMNQWQMLRSLCRAGGRQLLFAGRALHPAGAELAGLSRNVSPAQHRHLPRRRLQQRHPRQRAPATRPSTTTKTHRPTFWTKPAASRPSASNHGVAAQRGRAALCQRPPRRHQPRDRRRNRRRGDQQPRIHAGRRARRAVAGFARRGVD